MPLDPHWTYFTSEEVKGLVTELVAKLDMARKIAGIPFIITSGLRTSEENQQIPNAVQDSAHLSGLAVDLAATTSQDRFLMVEALLAAGFVRLGIYEQHVHCDIDSLKPQKVMWFIEGH